MRHMPLDANTIIILLLIGAAAGCLSGFIGIGGGLLIVPALMYFMGMSLPEASSPRGRACTTSKNKKTQALEHLSNQ